MKNSKLFVVIHFQRIIPLNMMIQKHIFNPVIILSIISTQQHIYTKKYVILIAQLKHIKMILMEDALVNILYII